jgi:NADH dehydrogenase
MTAAGDRVVTVFGGTGFLGHRVARQLRRHGFAVRIAARHPEHARAWFDAADPDVDLRAVDIHDEPSVAAALDGADGVVNATSLYVERGRATFQSVHVEAAGRVARLAQRAGVQRLVQLSGVGADPASRSLYIRKRGEGEDAVRQAFADALIVRPTVMFGADDAFLTTILGLPRRLPVYPLFGTGATRLQPVSVEDVAEAIARALQQPQMRAITCECGGPRLYSYKGLLRALAREAGVKPILMPLPFAAWHAIAWLAALLPAPPVTRSQVELMRIDTVPSPASPGLADLGIAPRPIEPEAAAILSRRAA